MGLVLFEKICCFDDQKNTLFNTQQNSDNKDSLQSALHLVRSSTETATNILLINLTKYSVHGPVKILE
jgi:hypothetical protein